MNTLFKPKEKFLATNYEVVGKWNKNKYQIIRALGFGENGVVYLVKSLEEFYALKMSMSTIDLSYEIQAIMNLNETQGTSLGFYIFDIDDFFYNGQLFTFYVMPYHKGITIKQFLYGKTSKEYLSTFNDISKILKSLHDAGFIFGDLKIEHIIVNPNNGKVSLIDFGGITKINEGVRQFTELYDRGSWKAGSRRGDPHYDLFSLAIVYAQLGTGKGKLIKIFNNSKSVKDVYDIIQGVDHLKPIAHILEDILFGKSTDTFKILGDLNKIKIKEVSKPFFSWLDLFLMGSVLLFLWAIINFVYFW